MIVRFAKKGKGNQTPLILLGVLVLIIFFASNTTLFSTAVDPVSGNFAGREWTGTKNTATGGCGTAFATFDSNKLFLSSRSTARDSCNPPGSATINVDTMLADFEKVSFDYVGGAHGGGGEGDCFGSGGASWNMLIGNEVIFEKSSSCDVAQSRSGSVNLVKTSNGQLDVFVSECPTCSLELVKTVAFDSTLFFGSSSSTGTGFGVGELTITNLVIVEITIECVSSQDCWTSKQSCGFTCSQNTCEEALQIQVVQFCSDNTTQIGTFPVCELNQCPSTDGCPVVVIPSCTNGTLIVSGVDENSCLLAPTCIEGNLADLQLTIDEYKELILALKLRVAEEAAIANELQLTLSQLIDLTNALELEVDEQLVFINNLNINLAQKEVLVSQLVITNEEQADLVAQMRGSFKEQADVINALNQTIEQDAELLNGLDLSLQAQKAIAAELALTVESQIALINALELSNDEKLELIKSLKINLAGQQEIIGELQLEEDKVLGLETEQLLFIVGGIIVFFIILRRFS